MPRTIMEAISEPTLVLRGDGTVLMANAAAEAQLGSIVTGERLSSLIRLTDVEDIVGELARCLEEGAALWGVARFRCVDGAERDFRYNAASIVADGAAAVLLRVFERQDVSATLADAELRRLNWALAACARSRSALIHSEDLDEIVRGICRAIVDSEIYALVWVGVVDHSPAKAININWAAGSAVGYLESLELSWSEESAFGSGPAGRAVRQGTAFIMRDMAIEATFAPWRERALRYGLRSSVTVPFKSGGSVIGMIAIYADRPDAFSLREMTLFEDLAQDLAFAFKMNDDRTRLEASRQALRAAEDAARETRAELARVGRLLTVGEFASSIAHEINQPIAAIIANADASLRWMAKEPPDQAEVRLGIQRILRDANRAGEVVKRARGWLSKEAPVCADLDVNEILAESLLLTQPEQQWAEVAVRMELTPALPAASGDRIQLQQVILNIVLNGMEAMTFRAEGARVLTVKSDVSDLSGVQVSIEDTGEGLDPDTIDRLFDHFYTTKRGGIGLGLPIARSIIEAHGGRLWATPAASGGAAFHFTLPPATGGGL